MKDIPIFDTENGVASLILREIPYTGRAYIKLLSTLEPEALLGECVAFCRACGAEECHASGQEYLARYPLSASLIRMTRDRTTLPQTDACLFPVTESTLADYIRVYNQRMAAVPNFRWMDSADGKEMLRRGSGYFVHREGALLGIGEAYDGILHTVIATQPYMGEAVVLALSGALWTDSVSLTVARENRPAMKLYQRMDFLPVEELSRWYRVL